MKVLCIDNSPGKWGYSKRLLKVGEPYNVKECYWDNSGYIVQGIEFDPLDGSEISFKKSRFIPISDIDETEMERNYNELLTNK